MEDIDQSGIPAILAANVATNLNALIPFPAATKAGPRDIAPANGSESASLNTFTMTSLLKALPPRIRGSTIDLTYELHGTATALKTVAMTIGRQLRPSRGRVVFKEVEGKRGLLQEIDRSGQTSSLPADPNYAAIVAAAKMLMPTVRGVVGEAVNGISPVTRAYLMQNVATKVHVDRLLWRLAVVYMAASWAAINGEVLRFGPVQPRTIRQCETMPAYNQAIEEVRRSAAQPVCVLTEHFGVAEVNALSYLAVVMAEGLQLDAGAVELPGVARDLPALGPVVVVGMGAVVPEYDPGDIHPETAFSILRLVANQHNASAHVDSYLRDVALLWFGPSVQEAPVYGGGAIQIGLPRLRTEAMTFMYAHKHEPEDHTPVPGSHVAREVFRRGAVVQVALSCALRQVMLWRSVWAAGSDQDYPGNGGCLASMLPRGGVAEVILAAEQVLKSLGGTGALGGIAYSITPPFQTAAQMLAWWARHETAHQWEECAPYLDAVPTSSMVMARIESKRTKEQLVVGRWYEAAKVYVAGDALLGAKRAYLWGADLAMRMNAANGAGSTVQPIGELATGYRGYASDWATPVQLLTRTMAFDVVVSAPTAAASIALHQTQELEEQRKWYITQPHVPGADEFDDAFAAYGGWQPGPAHGEPGEAGHHHLGGLDDAVRRSVAAMSAFRAQPGHAQPGGQHRRWDDDEDDGEDGWGATRGQPSPGYGGSYPARTGTSSTRQRFYGGGRLGGGVTERTDADAQYSTAMDEKATQDSTVQPPPRTPDPVVLHGEVMTESRIFGAHWYTLPEEIVDVPAMVRELLSEAEQVGDVPPPPTEYVRTKLEGLDKESVARALLKYSVDERHTVATETGVMLYQLGVHNTHAPRLAALAMSLSLHYMAAGEALRAIPDLSATEHQARDPQYRMPGNSATALTLYDMAMLAGRPVTELSPVLDPAAPPNILRSFRDSKMEAAMAQRAAKREEDERLRLQRELIQHDLGTTWTPQQEANVIDKWKRAFSVTPVRLRAYVGYEGAAVAVKYAPQQTAASATVVAALDPSVSQQQRQHQPPPMQSEVAQTAARAHQPTANEPRGDVGSATRVWGQLRQPPGPTATALNTPRTTGTAQGKPSRPATTQDLGPEQPTRPPRPKAKEAYQARRDPLETDIGEEESIASFGTNEVVRDEEGQ